MILLDTNLLTRLTSTVHPHGMIARVAIHKVLARREQIAVVPQNLYEFWAVATRNPGQRPAGENGLGFTTAQAACESGELILQDLNLPINEVRRNMALT